MVAKRRSKIIGCTWMVWPALQGLIVVICAWWGALAAMSPGAVGVATALTTNNARVPVANYSMRLGQMYIVPQWQEHTAFFP